MGIEHWVILVGIGLLLISWRFDRVEKREDRKRLGVVLILGLLLIYMVGHVVVQWRSLGWVMTFAEEVKIALLLMVLYGVLSARGGKKG